MRIIQLTLGKVTLVSDEDYNLLSKHKWHVKCNSGWYYAKNNTLGLMHRYITACPKGMLVDHADRDTLNNQRTNLRICNYHQNRANYKRSNKRYKGVMCYLDNGYRYHAFLEHKQKRIYLGSYHSEIEAALAYDAKAVELFGEFALLNITPIRSTDQTDSGLSAGTSGLPTDTPVSQPEVPAG
jgi:hypothetical protein